MKILLIKLCGVLETYVVQQPHVLNIVALKHIIRQLFGQIGKFFTYIFSTKQNTIKAKIARQTFVRNVAFTQILDLLNILLFQNTVDFVCLVIQRYSSKEKMRHSITQHCFNQMLLPFSKRFIQQPY